ncbi:MAG: Panacea domain-containing protein [Coriobacteriia bacterium]|nr:Panacea domain-containing protein [Coriobacteriia bacterium]
MASGETRADVAAFLLFRQGTLCQTKLMKLAYLADLEHMRRYGRPLSEASYRCDKYGVVDYALLGVAATMPDVRVKQTMTFFRTKGRDFSRTETLADPADHMSIQARSVLEATLEEYGSWRAGDLGDFTKTTPPWNDAKARHSPLVHLMVIAPKDKLAHLHEVLKHVDRSTRGSAEDLAKRDASVDRSIRKYRLRAMGG